MRKTLLTLACLCIANAFAANEVVRISLNETRNYALLADIDEIYFNDACDSMFIRPAAEEPAVGFRVADIREICYLSEDEMPSKLKIAYDGASVSIDNPYFLHGVSVVADGAYVTVNSTNITTEYTTELSGSTTNGAFTYCGSYKTTIALAGVSITSKQGAAIDIECGKRVALDIKKDTENTLIDAANGEQKAALYCKGHLEIDKAGTLNVTGKTAHAIAAKEYLKLKKSEGIINILGAVKDGIHCKQYFVGNGFNVNIKNVGDDNIQAELDGEENEDGIADGSIIINDGTYTITNSTNGSTVDNESHTVKGMNADGNIELNGGTINIAMSGTGGKGIKAEGTLSVGVEGGEGPTLTISTTGAAYSSSTTSTGGNTGGWGGGRPGGMGGGNQSSANSSSSKAIKVTGAVNILGGTTNISTTQNGAEGLESKTSITIAGGNHYLKCYDDCINSSGIIKFIGGNTVCYGYGNDAIDSNYGKSGAITIAGGNVFSYTTKGSPEEGLDCDNNSYITITGGIAISAGGSQGGGGGGWGGSSSSSQSVGSSSQGYYLGSSPSSYATSYYYTLCNTSGEAICTYKFEASVSNSLSLLTAPNLGKGSITVKRGTTAPTEYASKVDNPAGTGVFYIAPMVSTSSTVATVTAK